MGLRGRVKELREKKGFSQKRLADASGITQATISRIESGKMKGLKSDALRKLGMALGVTVDYLVGRTDELTPSEIASSDPVAKDIIKNYGELNSFGRKMLSAYARFLVQEDTFTYKGMGTVVIVDNAPRPIERSNYVPAR